jgi:catechol 2,3-dioxygenase-like lactoylglutathione lyase family enzyme
MPIHSISHVQLAFAPGEHAIIRHFYGQLLGLFEQRPQSTHALRFYAGSQRVDLVPSPDLPPAATRSHLAFEVQNLPGLRARLLDAGLQLDESQALAGHLRFYVRDPAGNALEFLEPDPSQASTV